ncbi:kynurenine formamidase [Haloferula luteola]|uniref:Kynurenine formamidase n=1 Tax=Haloferula luteola TaxID=595692 RepID=A0A840UVX2_9BACT|nr:cyclase family protein [Haloferula luteola]MBB5349932.1 kynurenine formamidase [Haloferula luteola]
MRIFDLSQPVTHRGPNCPVHPPIELPRIADHPTDGWRMEVLHFASHTGTHLDAPLHKLANGASIDAFPLEAFAGRAVVADLDGIEAGHPIGPEDLETTLTSDLEDSIVLLNTGWGHRREKSEEWHYRSPYLSPAGAEWLVAKKIRAVGIDHYSIGGSCDPDNTRTHEIILGAGIWVVEDLCFRDGWREAASGTFQALPLSFPGFSGTPCRAVFIND